MTKEGYEILKRMDITAAENQMALHCAPFIMGLKPSNLLMLQSSQTDDAQKLLRQAGTDCFLLYKGAVNRMSVKYWYNWAIAGYPFRICLPFLQGDIRPV